MRCYNKQQKLIDICFEIAMTLHDPKYRKHFHSMDKEHLAKWVRHQLKGCGFDTEPCGSSWGVLKKEPLINQIKTLSF